jgi:hypothetical protein
LKGNDIIPIKNLSIIERNKIIMPEPFNINENQRPYPMK